MSRVCRLVVVALALAFCSTLARAEEPARVAVARSPGDFAEGLALAIQPQLSVQTLIVPIAVYRGLRPAQDDLGVFNAAGEPVAFALRTLDGETRRHEQELPVPLFPIRVAEHKANAGGLRLHVERDAAGTVVDIVAPDEKRAPARSKLVSYVFDTSKLEQAATRLKLSLELGDDSVTTPVWVEASHDLAAWSEVASGVVGQLSHAGQRIQRSELELAPTRAPFLRLRWEGSLPALTGATLVVAREQVEREAALARVEISARRVSDHVYRADLGALLNLVRLAPRLPENSLIAGSMSLGSEPEQTSEPLFTGQLYRLQHEGAELVSPAVEVGARRARYLTMRVDPRTDMLPATLVFDVTYAPEQLLFLTRGQGPYLLTFGSYKETAPAFSAEQLLAFMPASARTALPNESARVLEPVQLTGAAARRAPPAPRSYRMQVLWAVLIVGAGTLVVLALRLLRRMQA